MSKISQKLKTKSQNNRGGFTLVEMLVALMVFSIMGVLVTQSLVLSLRGARKSESIARVKENVSYAMGVMEQHLRNAEDLDCSSSSNSKLNYIDENGSSTYFECSGSFIVFGTGTARLTSNDVVIGNGCDIFTTCTDGTVGDVPDSVQINIQASSTNATGAEGFQVSSSSTIFLRTYSL